MRESQELAGSKDDGKSVKVPVDVHYSHGGWTTTDEEHGEPGQPDSDSSDGMTIWHLREDVEVDKGRRRQNHRSLRSQSFKFNMKCTHIGTYWQIEQLHLSV